MTASQVVVIPVGGKVSVKSTPALDGLKDFDPKVEYSTEGKTGVRLLSKAATQIEMGKISNLITDMTLKGPPRRKLLRPSSIAWWSSMRLSISLI